MIKTAFIVLGSLLVLSIAGNVGLYRVCREFYLREARQRLDPLGLVGAPQPGERGCGIHVVFFGDSRAEQWLAPQAPEFSFSNHGIGGQTTEQVRLRIGSVLAEKSVDAVVVEAGMNDLKYIPLMPGKRREITERCVSNLREITSRLRDGGCAVVICTVFPCGEVPLERRLWWSPEVDAAIAEVNREIAGMAGEGVTVFDAAAILAGPDGRIRGEFSRDLLHLNAAAYAALNEPLIGCLKKLPPRKVPPAS